MTYMIVALVSMITTHCLGAAQEGTLEQSLLKNVPAWMAENHVPCVGVGLIKDAGSNGSKHSVNCRRPSCSK